MMRSLIINKPDDPVKFLIDKLDKPESKLKFLKMFVGSFNNFFNLNSNPYCFGRASWV